MLKSLNIISKAYNRNDNQLFDSMFEAIVEGIAQAILEVAGDDVVENVNTCPNCGQRIS